MSPDVKNCFPSGNFPLSGIGGRLFPPDTSLGISIIKNNARIFYTKPDGLHGVNWSSKFVKTQQNKGVTNAWLQWLELGGGYGHCTLCCMYVSWSQYCILAETKTWHTVVLSCTPSSCLSPHISWTSYHWHTTYFIPHYYLHSLLSGKFFLLSHNISLLKH